MSDLNTLSALIKPYNDIIFVVLTFWPCVVLLRRLGLKVQLAGLLVLSLLLPLLGHMLLAVCIAIKPWPNFPPLPKRVKREKLS